MEPISILLLAALITKVVATHREDMEYARHGQESPRYKMKLAKLAAAQKAGKPAGRPPARPGATGYAQELWRDAWEDLTEQRRRNRTLRKEDAKRELQEWSKRTLNTRPDGRPVDDMLDVAGVRPGTPETGGSIPTPPQPTTTAPPAAPPAPADPYRSDAPTAVCDQCGQPADVEPWCEHRRHAWERFQASVRGALNAEETPPADDAPDKCNRCPHGRIVDTRPWPGVEAPFADTDYRCNRCGWLSSHLSGLTWDQHLAALAGRERFSAADQDAPTSGEETQTREFGKKVSDQLGHMYGVWCGDPACACTCPRCGAAAKDPDLGMCRTCQGHLDGLYWLAVQALRKVDPDGSRRKAAEADAVAAIDPIAAQHCTGKEITDMVTYARMRRTEEDGEPTPDTEPETQPVLDNTDDPIPDNVIHLFPNAKETVMTANANAEATGLPTAIAYAESAATAHEAFATAGSEGYIGALEGFEVSGEALAAAKEAQEASTTAAAKWREHYERLVDQMKGREFYQSNPDAGNKAFLSGE